MPSPPQLPCTGMRGPLYHKLNLLETKGQFQEKRDANRYDTLTRDRLDQCYGVDTIISAPASALVPHMSYFLILAPSPAPAQALNCYL